VLAQPHAGFTYLTVLFVLAFMGVGWSLAGEVWHTSRLRENEAELIFVGNQYRRAIALYFQNGAGTTNRYPRELADLLKDPQSEYAKIPAPAVPRSDYRKARVGPGKGAGWRHHGRP